MTFGKFPGLQPRVEESLHHHRPQFHQPDHRVLTDHQNIDGSGIFGDGTSICSLFWSFPQSPMRREWICLTKSVKKSLGIQRIAIAIRSEL
jgi:hypothetical protein